MKYIYRVFDYIAWFWFIEWLILVYIINRIIHGRLEIWNLSSRVHIRYVYACFFTAVRVAVLNSLLNPIIYSFRMRQFRIAFVDLRCRTTNIAEAEEI